MGPLLVIPQPSITRLHHKHPTIICYSLPLASLTLVSPNHSQGNNPIPPYETPSKWSQWCGNSLLNHGFERRGEIFGRDERKKPLLNAWSNPLWPFGPSSRCSSKFDGSGDSTHPTRVASASLSWRPIYAAKLGIEGSKNSDTSTKGTDPIKVRLNCGLDMLEYCAIPFFSLPPVLLNSQIQQNPWFLLCQESGTFPSKLAKRCDIPNF